MQILNYGRSFLQSLSKPGTNRVRFWVESWTRVTDEREGRHEDFYQCGSCKSEYCWEDRGMFQPDNYDFLPVFGPAHVLVFRRKAWLNPNYRSTYAANEEWQEPTFHLQTTTACELKTMDALRAATDAATPIVAETELQNSSTGLRAVVQYPVKTLNMSPRDALYQVDTGPVCLPDLATRPKQLVDALALAFIAFNTPDHAEAVVETTTALDSGERVYHYSDVQKLAVQNRFYAAKG